MTTYADPTRCPDCRALLPHDPQVCQFCALPLTGETAVSLFQTFQEADRLLGVLRAQRRSVVVSAAAAAPAASASGTRLEGVAPYPVQPSRAAATERPQLRGPSVPRILLSLGALCLLVAAVIFLAYAWRWLGVGGRTGVLVGLTGVSLGTSVAVLRRGLATAAESLSVVGLGLVAIDVVGARHAGWLGAIDDAQLTLVAGAVVATAALVLLVSASRPMYAPAVIAPLAVLAATFGGQSPVETPLPSVLGIVVLLGLARVGTVLPTTTLAYASVAAAVPAWLYLGVAGLDLAGDPITFAHYFGDLHCWPVLALTALAAASGPATGVRRVEVGGYAVASLAGTFGAVLPVLDNGTTAATAVLTAGSMLWAVAVIVGPKRLRAAALLPLAVTLLLPAVASCTLVFAAARAATTVDRPFTRSFDVHVAATHGELSPLLLVPSVIALAVAACAALSGVEPVRRSTWLTALAAATALGGVGTLPLYDVPLASVVGVLVLAGIAAFAVAERVQRPRDDAARLAGLVLVTLGILLALPSDRMATAALSIACLIAGHLMFRADATAAVSALCFPLGFAALGWSGGHVLAVDAEYLAVPVLLVLGALAIWRPEPELEASSALAGATVSAAAVLLARDVNVSLAVHLTVAGVLVTTSSIVHPTRRGLAWVGGLLLAAATWVRLYDLGVDAPEAYTLPSALALVVVGAWRLRRDDRSATLSVLAPGLALATVPSLVAMLDEPYSLRALLLGATCLALVVGGAALRWGAPIVVGAVVGGLVVVRELAPYAASVPTWLSIGVSGAVLLGVGITWESRMQDVRRASRYVAALR